MRTVGEEPQPETWLPTDLYYCDKCELVQLGCIGDANVVFPPSYPYTSGTTRILRDNFADLACKAKALLKLKPDDLVIDIGSNDGTLLSNFAGHKCLGIEPTDVADVAAERGIPTRKEFFSYGSSCFIRDNYEKAKLITACNVFAHIEDPHGAIEGIKQILAPDGIFISESHYLFGLIERAQYDTIYHEHLRYYSVSSLRNLLKLHGLNIFKVEHIPTHGGSIRIYAARDRAERIHIIEPTGIAPLLNRFAAKVKDAKRNLLDTVLSIKFGPGRLVGIGAPSRAAVVINYCGLDHTLLDYVCEIDGSLKIGKYMPGTMIPVVNESVLYQDQPDYALIFSWHIADEIKAALRAKGYRGEFILPIEARLLIREEWEFGRNEVETA